MYYLLDRGLIIGEYSTYEDAVRSNKYLYEIFYSVR